MGINSNPGKVAKGGQRKGSGLPGLIVNPDAQSKTGQARTEHRDQLSAPDGEEGAHIFGRGVSFGHASDSEASSGWS